MTKATGLHLLLTTRASGGGGAERVWSTIARRFAARGDRVTLAIDALDGDIGLDETTNPRLEVIGEGHFGGTLKLARFLSRERPDVALAAVSASCVKLAVASLLSGRHTPLVVSYHGFEEWKTGRLAALAYHGLPLANRMVDRIVTVSDGLRERLVGEWGAAPEKTVRIYNPVSLDLAAAAASAADLASRPPHVVAVGRLSAEKGLADLLAAFARVPRPDLRLSIAGDGPERERLRAQAAALGIADRVVFLGHVDPSALYRTARVVVVPSRTEAFGLVLVEALAHGLPVVATDCPGPTEILENGRYGRIVPIGAADAMASAIVEALDAPGDPAPRIARAAHFSLEEGFAHWAALVDGIVAARRRDR